MATKSYVAIYLQNKNVVQLVTTLFWYSELVG